MIIPHCFISIPAPLHIPLRVIPPGWSCFKAPGAPACLPLDPSTPGMDGLDGAMSRRTLARSPNRAQQPHMRLFRGGSYITPLLMLRTSPVARGRLRLNRRIYRSSLEWGSFNSSPADRYMGSNIPFKFRKSAFQAL